jgi:N-acetylglucosaminyldiphosphoundecaprenol N-acetyl-beta-D-mannosaminyltransferase
MNDQTPYQTIAVLGTRLDLCDKQTLMTIIQQAAVQRRQIVALSGNVYSFNLAYENKWLRDFLNQADIIRLDGVGLRLGARLLGASSPPRMTWADFAWDLAELCEQNDFTLFFLGAKPSIAAKAAQQMQIKHPRLRFAGIHHGYFDKEKGSAENTAVINLINQSQPHILIIGFGMPLQEKWLSQNIDDVRVPVIMTGGAVFDYISGELQRAPKWMTDYGLEWFGRLLIEPHRLWHRYLIGNPKFLWRVLLQRLNLLRLE